MWRYLKIDYFINPLPGYVENIADDPESRKAIGNHLQFAHFDHIRAFRGSKSDEASRLPG